MMTNAWQNGLPGYWEWHKEMPDWYGCRSDASGNCSHTTVLRLLYSVQLFDTKLYAGKFIVNDSQV